MKERIIRTGKFAFSKGKFVLMLAGIAILLLLIRKVGLDELLAVWNSMNKFYVLLAIIPWVLTIIFGAYRLKKIVNSDIGFFEIFKIYSYGYLLNYASPIQGFGAGAKVAMLKMKNVKISRSSASVGLEIIYDLMFTVIITAIFLFYHLNFVIVQLKQVLSIKLVYCGVVIIVVVLTAAWLFRKHKFVEEFFDHVIGSFKLNNIARLTAMTALMWVLPAIVIYMLFAAIKAPVSIWVILGSLCIGFIFGLATFIPGGLGVRDAITAYIYSLSGIPLGITISVAIFNRFFTIGIVFLMVVAITIYEKFGNISKNFT